MSHNRATQTNYKQAKQNIVDELIFKYIASSEQDFEFTHAFPGPGPKVKVVESHYLQTIDFRENLSRTLELQVVIPVQEIRESLERLCAVSKRVKTVMPFLRRDGVEYLYVNPDFVDVVEPKEKILMDRLLLSEIVLRLEDIEFCQRGLEAGTSKRRN